jgi:hypothetical protein
METATTAAQAIASAAQASAMSGEATAIQAEVTKNHAARQEENAKILATGVIFRKLLSGNKLHKRYGLNRTFAA